MQLLINKNVQNNTRLQVNLWVEFLTVFEVWLTEVQVLAGASGAVLGAQREAHVLDLLSEGVEGTEDLLHAFTAHQELGAGGVGCRHVGVVLGEQLTGVDGALGLGTSLYRKWLNDLALWALGKFTFESINWHTPRCAERG